MLAGNKNSRRAWGCEGQERCEGNRRGGELKARRLGSRKEWLVGCFRQVKDQDGPRARMEPALWCLGKKNEP